MKQETETDWSPNRVLYELHEKGISLRALAARNGVCVQALSEALYFPYPASERRIAAALCLSPKTIWPSRHKARQQRSAA